MRKFYDADGQVVDNGPAHLRDLLLKDEVKNLEVVDHMAIWEVDLILSAPSPSRRAFFTCMLNPNRLRICISDPTITSFPAVISALNPQFELGVLAIPKDLIMKPGHLETEALPQLLLLLPFPIPSSYPRHVPCPIRVDGEGLVSRQEEEVLDSGCEKDVGVDQFAESDRCLVELRREVER